MPRSASPTGRAPRADASWISGGRTPPPSSPVAIVGRTKGVLEKAAKDLTERSPIPGTRGPFDDLTDERWREAFGDGAMGMVHGSDFT